MDSTFLGRRARSRPPFTLLVLLLGVVLAIVVAVSV